MLYDGNCRFCGGETVAFGMIAFLLKVIGKMVAKSPVRIYNMYVEE